MGALSGELAGRRVGVYGSAGAPYAHLAFAALHGAEARVVRAEDVAAAALASAAVAARHGATPGPLTPFLYAGGAAPLPAEPREEPR